MYMSVVTCRRHWRGYWHHGEGRSTLVCTKNSGREGEMEGGGGGGERERVSEHVEKREG